MNANKIYLKDINNQIENNQTKFIEECEQKFKAQTNSVLNFLVQNRNIKFILLAGPSSSGKTTTSRLLTETLRENGYDAVPISLDDFFVERENTPLWKDGTYNYETFEAIDWKLFGRCMRELLEKGESILPIYDFKTGVKYFADTPTKLKEDTVVIIEGLHALNPIIDKYIPKNESMRVFTCVNTNIYSGNQVFMMKENVRFYRRLIRDLFTRNISIEQTIEYWQKVNLGEELYINPYIDLAQIKIDSFHAYELGVYENVLKTFSHFDSKHLEEAKKILSKTKEIDFKTVPNDSLLQEFIPKQ